MLSLQRVSLILAITLVVSLLAFLGATYNIGETSAASGTLKGKVLRRHDQTKLKPSKQELDSLRGQGTPKLERGIEDKIPKHVPLKVKLKSEKEKAFRDLDNDQWERDFELEVTNTSGKPIYFLELWLMLPEVKSENNNQIAFPLRYGRADFTEFTTRPIDTDVPIRPGETYTFAIPETYQKGWRAFKLRGNGPNPRKVEIKFVHLSFGDGTGFNRTDAKPYPYKREQSLNDPCRGGPMQTEDKASWKSARMPLPALRKQSFLPTPAAILPVTFFLVQASYRKSEQPTSPDINCPGTDCIFAKSSTYQCVCDSNAAAFQIVGSSDPAGSCSIPASADTLCTDLGVYCPQWALGPCAPTPTPTPTPTCNLSTKPNDHCVCDTTPLLVGAPPKWVCFCFSGGTPSDHLNYPQNYGCPPNKRSNGNDCCLCVLETCPDGSAPNKDTCACPTPTPTPAPTQLVVLTTGGGDGSEPGDVIENCNNYYWVWYSSSDGGETWTPTGQIDSAGCW